jgi:hypothetical protein
MVPQVIPAGVAIYEPVYPVAYKGKSYRINGGAVKIEIGKDYEVESVTDDVMVLLVPVITRAGEEDVITGSFNILSN